MNKQTENKLIITLGIFLLTLYVVALTMLGLFSGIVLGIMDTGHVSSIYILTYGIGTMGIGLGLIFYTWIIFKTHLKYKQLKQAQQPFINSN